MRSDEAGWTLIELMIVCLIAIVVMGVPLALSTQSVVSQNEATSRAAATNRTEVGMAKFLHDLRHAVSPSTVTSTGATLTLPIRSASGGTAPLTQQVTWTCATSCTRRIGAGSAQMVIPYVVSAAFAATSAAGLTVLPLTDPAYVSLTVGVFVSNEQNAAAHTATVPGASRPIVVTDGAALRNFTT